MKERQPPLRKEVLELTAEEDTSEAVHVLVKEVLADSMANVLVFVYQTRSAERLATSLKKTLGEQAGSYGPLAYHAQMSAAQRKAVSDAFRTGWCRCVVATTALGMGVNLPATHVIVRDTTFPGFGPVPTEDLLQMMGRAGRGEGAGHSTAIVRPHDIRSADELVRALREENLPDLASRFQRTTAQARKRSAVSETDIAAVATHVIVHLARNPEIGSSLGELEEFFGRSLGGKEFAAHVPAALTWLAEPARLLAFRDEHGRYRPTTLGLTAVRAVLPLALASGFAQLLRDLLSLDSSDQLLARWHPLDHFISLELLSDRSPKLRRFSTSLANQLEAWMENTRDQAPLLYTDWIAGGESVSRASEVLGSLGINPVRASKGEEQARKEAYLATLRAVVLHELGQGIPADDLEHRWGLKGLVGVEERWRDSHLWLLSGLSQMLDLRCFYFHLREDCAADTERVRRVKALLIRMRAQVFALQDRLKYCSPLGSILYSLRRTQPDGVPSVGLRSIRRLEEAGIKSLNDLASLQVNDLIQLGVRPSFAKQIRAYVACRLE